MGIVLASGRTNFLPISFGEVTLPVLDGGLAIRGLDN